MTNDEKQALWEELLETLERAHRYVGQLPAANAEPVTRDSQKRMSDLLDQICTTLVEAEAIQQRISGTIV